MILIMLPLTVFALGNYHSVATPGFKVFYRKGWEAEAIKVLEVMEFYKPYVEDLTGNQLGQSNLVLEDMGNEVNGYTDLLGDKIALFAYPPTGDELSNGEDWWQLVGVHEYIHQSQMSIASGFPGILRKVFGNGFYPNLHQPNWVTEGITVYGESNLSPYAGRMRGGYYNTVITALAKAGKLPSPAKATIYSRDTPGGNFYVFGGSFFSYLAETYGKDKFAQYFALQGSKPGTYLSILLPALSINSYFKQTYGVPLDSLWNDWKVHEANRALSLPQDRLTHQGWNCSGLTSHAGEIYYSRHKNTATGPFSQFTDNHILHLKIQGDKVREEILLQQATDFPAGFQVVDKRLFYTRSEYRNGFANNENNGLGSVTELWVKDLERGNTQKLLSGSIRSFCVLSSGDILVATDEAQYRGNLLSLYSPSGQLKSGPSHVNMLIGNMIEHEGKLYVSGKEDWKSTGIYEADLQELVFSPLIYSPYAEKLVGISGTKLIFDAPYNDQLNSYAYDLSTGETFKLSGLSGLRSTVLTDEGSFYSIGMNPEGEDIYRGKVDLSAFALPKYEPAKLPVPFVHNEEHPLIVGKYPVQKGGYGSNLKHLLFPRIARIPYLMGSRDSLSLGLFLMGQDLLGDFPGWTARLQYDLKAKQFGADISLTNNIFRPVNQTLSYSSLGEGSFSADQYIDLLKRKNYGVNRVWLGFALSAQDDFERKIWDGYTGVNFSWEGGRLGLSQAVFMERTDFLPSDRERLGLQTRLSLKQRVGDRLQLLARLHYANDPDAETDEVFSTIRGYDRRWDQKQGFNLATSLNFPLLRIRDGLWTPQVYLEDIFGGVFFDASIPQLDDESKLRYATGLELISELYLASVIRLGLGFRFSVNKEGDWLPGLILGTDF